MDFGRQPKELKNKIQEAVYNSLSLLSGIYPTTEEFDRIFLKDMFIKNDKVEFFEVIHYLLNILDPELTKKYLVSWPICDPKKEAKFRTELVTYIKTINSTYCHADIPVCRASNLIYPQGSWFTKFVLKISQLVIYEHLKKSKPYLLHRLEEHRLSKDTYNLKKETKLIESETKELLQNFEKTYLNTTDIAKETSKKLEQRNKDICNAEKLLEDIQIEFNMKYPSYPSFSSLEEQLIALKQQVERVLELDNLFSSSEKLVRSLSGPTMTLEHRDDNFAVPTDIGHIITERKKLDLCQFFQGLIVLLEKKAFQLQSPSPNCILQTKETIENSSAKNQIMLQELQFEQERINTLLDGLNDALRGCV